MKTAALLTLPETGKGIYAIAGICKNCGKTSFLNYLTATLEGRRLGILTTGRDGEDKDVVFGNVKPAVFIPAKTLFTALPQTVEKLGSAVKILRKLPQTVAGKSLWLLEALRELEAEITGPSTANAQVQAAELMLAQGVETVLIDGSLDRKSIALHPRVKGVYLVAGGSYGTLEKIETELNRLLKLSQLPVCREKQLPETRDFIHLHKGESWQKTGFNSLLNLESELADLIDRTKPDAIYLPGALTENVLTELQPMLKGVQELVFRHSLLLHIGSDKLDRLAQVHLLSCLRPFNILAVILNSWSVKGTHLDSSTFRDEMRRKFPSVPIIDIYEDTTSLA